MPALRLSAFFCGLYATSDGKNRPSKRVSALRAAGDNLGTSAGRLTLPAEDPNLWGTN